MLCSLSLSAQTSKTRILFVLDGSGSMQAKMDSETRIAVAKRLLTRLVDSLEHFDNVELALRVYGHQSPKSQRNCKDTKLEVGFGRNNETAIKQRMGDIYPKGTTLIAYSLEQAAYDFPREPGVRNVIILITDGIEECEGDPCAVSRALQKQGVILRPFIIGLGLSAEFKSQFECVGRFFEAETESEFKNVLNVVISQAINNTTVQINLLDAYGKPTESDVSFTLTDAKTGKILYNYVHTLDYRGNPDTLYIDPSYSYNIKVHTTPAVYKYGIELRAGMHNVIAVDCPQGTLSLRVDGRTSYPDLQALVKDPVSGTIVDVQSFNTDQKYLVGEYDLEILSLPRINKTGVPIHQSTTTTVHVQQPGKLNIIARKNIVVDLFYYKDGELTLLENISLDNMNSILVLQPGQYQLILRESNIKETLKTKIITFEIASGEVKHLNLQ